jgi:2'-5' RNA ligase
MALADLRPGEHAEHVRNHWWWRPGWRPGRRFYALHITFAGSDELKRLAATYRQALADLPWLTFVPDRWLHLTVQGIGFADELGTAKLDDLVTVAQARLRDLPPFSLTFDSAVVADEAIALPAEPPRPVRQLRSAIRAAIGQALGEQRVSEDPERFRPHVSVAYMEAPGVATPYVRAVRKAQPAAALVIVRQVDLIEMHRDDRMYEWTTVDRLLLGSSGKVSPR